MNQAIRDLGVQSYCYRGYDDNATVAQHVRELDLDTIELCAKHVDFDDPAQHEPTIKAYHDAGVRIASIGVQMFTGDEQRERNWFEFAKEAGAGFISANFKPDNWQQAADVAARLAKEYDIQLGIHNHGGYHWLGCWQMLDHVFRNVDPTIGLCLDTAWCLDAGENPLKWIDAFKQRVVGIHIKDFIFDRAGKGEDVIVGTGNLDLPGLLAALDEINFAGYAVLEYEGDVENPTPALGECVRQVRMAAASS